MTNSILSALQARFGSADFSKWQIIRQPWYDYVRYPTAGTNQLTFFTVPQGSVDPNGSGSKSAEQTNLQKAGSFGNTFFLMTNIRTHVNILAKNRQSSATISGDANAVFHGFTSQATNVMVRLNNLFNTGVLNSGFQNKSYYQIQTPFRWAPPGFGVQVHSYGASKVAGDAVKGSYWIQQDNGRDNVYTVDPIQMIEAETPIQATIDFPAGTSPVFTNTYLNQAATQATPTIEIGLIFDGYLIRPTA